MFAVIGLVFVLELEVALLIDSVIVFEELLMFEFLLFVEYISWLVLAATAGPLLLASASTVCPCELYFMYLVIMSLMAPALDPSTLP